MNNGLLKEKQFMNPANVGIYFDANTLNQEQNNLSRNINSGSGQRKNQKRGVSVGFMGGNSNKVNVPANPINTVRKPTPKNNNIYSTVPHIPPSQNPKNKQTIPNTDKTFQKNTTNKIPITLNTLLINGYDAKGSSGVSAHNLRKILSIGNSDYNSNSLYTKNTSYK